MRNTQISPERKGLYYFGMALAVIGFLSFASVFVSAAANFGDFSDFEGRTKSMVTRSLGGMGLIITGFVFLIIGRAGVAGSGVVLDPEKARKDVEPWSRMTGGMVKDALDEAGITLGQARDAGELASDERLRRLHKLREEGIVSEQEYEQKKKEILDEF